MDFLPFIASMSAVAASQVVRRPRPCRSSAGTPATSERHGGATPSIDKVTPTKLPAGGLRVDREDRARGGRRAQTESKITLMKTPVMPPAIMARISLRLHQHVGEVDLVDAAEEVDDRGAGRRGLGQRPCRRPCRRAAGRDRGRGWPRAGRAPTCPISAASAVPSGVSTPWLIALLRNSTLAGSMISEVSGSRSLLDQEVDAVRRAGRRCHVTIGPMPKNAEDRQEHAPDAGGEVVDQHLEAGPDLAVPERVDLLHRPAAERAHDHGAHEHRDLGAGDDAHGRDRADHATAGVVEHLAAGVADQDRQQVGDHRADDAAAGEVAPAADLRDPAVGEPSPMPSSGSQPTSMNRAVIRPHAMNAPMLGMTMLDRNVPNFCTWTRAPVRGCGCLSGHRFLQIWEGDPSHI